MSDRTIKKPVVMVVDDNDALAATPAPNEENQLTFINSPHPKGKMTIVTHKRRVEIPERLQALLVDDFDHHEFHRKMELLRCRYKHAVKSELINFCYASADPANDDSLTPEISNKSAEFTKTLMGVVEKDKDVADLAVTLVEEMEALEKAPTTKYISKKAGPETEESVFQQIWENHTLSRKHVSKMLDEERKEIYGEKDVSNDVKLMKFDPTKDHGDSSSSSSSEDESDLSEFNYTSSVKEKMDIVRASSIPPPETKEELREKEISRGIEKVMKRLGCEGSFPSKSYQDDLRVIQSKVQTLLRDVQKLKGEPSSSP